MPVPIQLIPGGGLRMPRGGNGSDVWPSKLMSTTAPDGAGRLVFPGFTRVTNAYYDSETGWPHKMLGASTVNSSPYTSGTTPNYVFGMYDYWRQGTAGTPTQDVVALIGDDFVKMDACDGTWDLISSTGAAFSALGTWSVMGDELIISTEGGTRITPRTWDQTTLANLGGTPPTFAFSVQHKGRLFAAGAVAVPSRLYWSAFANHEDWTGTGSGSIDVFTDDGDGITGLASHKNELIIFKGPVTGSIHRLVGSAPTGSDGFALIPMVRGVGATSHSAIVHGLTDLVFWDHHGIHSLDATAKFGDYAPAFLSDAIRMMFSPELTRGDAAYEASLDHTNFNQVNGCHLPGRSLMLWACRSDRKFGLGTNDVILTMDYRWSPPRFTTWTAYEAFCVATVFDPVVGTASPAHLPWFGLFSGTALRGERITQQVNSVDYSTSFQLPYLSFGDPFVDKKLRKVYLGQFTGSAGDVATIVQARDNVSGATTSVSVTLAAPSTDLVGQAKFHQLTVTSSAASSGGDFRPQAMSVLLESAGIGTVRGIG